MTTSEVVNYDKIGYYEKQPHEHAWGKKLDPEVKQDWLRTLRSGRIEQGEGFLCTLDNKMCCLGVLYHIRGESYWYEKTIGRIIKDKTVWAMVDNSELDSEHLDGYGLPTLEFLEKVKLDSEDAEYLAELNDSGLTFREIADVIEKYL